MNGEQIATLVVLSVLTLPILIIGIVLCCGKGGDFIAGFNTSSPAEKAKWNETALCRGTGVLVLGTLLCIELSILGGVLGKMPLVYGGVVLLAIILVFGLLYINKSKRFKK